MYPTLYLASASPRRRELLEQMGVAYELLSVDVPEEPLEGEAADIYALRVAVEKARAGHECLPPGRPRPSTEAATTTSPR